MAQIYNQVKLATTTDVNLATSILTGVTKIDNVIVNEFDRILVKAQTDKKQNGIYTISSAGVWDLASDFATMTVQDPGTIVMVTQGDTFADTGWTISSDGSLIVGESDIEFERITLNAKTVSEDLVSSLVLRSVKGRPLTNAELDNNFKFLGVGITEKLNIVDFNALSIVSRINTLSSAQAGLNAHLLRGSSPSITATGSSIVLRDTFGNIITNNFIGTLLGNAATATNAAFATVSGNVIGTVSIANGGTGTNSASAARIALGVLAKSGDNMTGMLTLAASDASRASLNIAQGVKPTDPEDGDVWSNGAFIHYQLNNTVQRVAHLDSPAFEGVPTAPTPGTASNNGTIATTSFVRNVKTAEIDPAIAIKANTASPTLTGNPTAPTALTSNISTTIANTQFVKNYLDFRFNVYESTGASKAALAGNVTGIVAIANGGTGANGAAGARNALGVVSKSGDAMTGKLYLFPSTANQSSLQIPPGIAPNNPNNGDIWANGNSLYYSLTGNIQEIARTNSPVFTGNPVAPTTSVESNNTSIATTAFVKSVKTSLIDPAIASKADTNSPTFTGNPVAPTALTSNISTTIANTQFVKNYLDSSFNTYDKWGTSRKFVQSTDPGNAAVDGDFWFKV